MQGQKSAALTKKTWVEKSKRGNGAFLGPKKIRAAQAQRERCSLGCVARSSYNRNG